MIRFRFPGKLSQCSRIIVAIWMLVVSIAPDCFPAETEFRDAQRALAPQRRPSVRIGRVPLYREIDLFLGLPLRHQDRLDRFLQSVSTPGTSEYRRYLTPREFADQFGPTAADYQSVLQFARENGLSIIRQYPNRTLLHVRGRIDQIEEAFQTRLFNYQHPTENRLYFAPDSVPTPNRHIPFSGVSGLSSLNPPRPASLHASGLVPGRNPKPANGSDSTGNYIGTDFRNAYLPGVALDGAGQRLALVEFDGYYPKDITLYLQRAKLGAVTLTNIHAPGYTTNIGANNVEVALDIEMAICMAPGLDSILVYEGMWPMEELIQIADDNLASQISCSWYWDDPSERNLLQATLQQFAAQGQTYLTASGDSGAWLSDIGDPIDSPWVTAVGGTTLKTTSAGGPYASESVWNWSPGLPYASGGGISTTYPLPSWQASVGAAIGGASTNARNLPDVAMVADRIFVFYGNGASGSVGGTSASAPLWAGVIALANQQSAAAGLPPIGFINPLLYQIGGSTNYARAFHDITVGKNSLVTNANQPYVARPGFDLCTGWGSPRGTALINLLSPPAPPTIQSTPTQQVVITGGTVQFAVAVTGTSPFTYRWRTGGIDLAGATNSVLILTNVQPVQSGDYWVVVTNIAGSVTSQVALLTVVPDQNQSPSTSVMDEPSGVPLFSIWHWAALASGLFAIGSRFGLMGQCARQGAFNGKNRE